MILTEHLLIYLFVSERKKCDFVCFVAVNGFYRLLLRFIFLCFHVNRFIEIEQTVLMVKICIHTTYQIVLKKIVVFFSVQIALSSAYFRNIFIYLERDNLSYLFRMFKDWNKNNKQKISKDPQSVSIKFLCRHHFELN